MQFHHRVPRPPLDAFVNVIWLCRNDPRPVALERVLPTGAAQLIVNLKEDETRIYDPEEPLDVTVTDGTVLTGVQSRFQIIDTSEQECVAGVAFKPGGVAAFFSAPAHETSDADTSLELLWGRRRASDLRDQLLERNDPDAQLDVIERALSEVLRPAGVHPAVAFALRAFDRAPLTTNIAAVTDAIGMSAKRFIERFRSEVGFSPKRYCRIRRFQRAVTRAHRGHLVDWPQVALECGYYDQAHFIHEFRSFAGLTPTGYQGARTAFQNHVKFLQSDVAVV
ncbi:MAG TPA: AraC family transcriptional regulator [Vicinamibacterales bacterium]|jgi:AraC-like DNA-binding protein